MADKIKDEMLENVSGGLDDNAGLRSDRGVVMAPSPIEDDCFFVKTETSGQVSAYNVTGCRVVPGMIVEVEFSRPGRWSIIRIV